MSVDKHVLNKHVWITTVLLTHTQSADRLFTFTRESQELADTIVQHFKMPNAYQHEMK